MYVAETRPGEGGTEDCSAAGIAVATAHQHERLASGMRWTLWLSLFTAPCGYASSIILARVSPEAIGTYGLLSLYVGVTSVFLFLGGPAVAIKFIPEIVPERRISFLLSYFLVACGAALPYQLA